MQLNSLWRHLYMRPPICGPRSKVVRSINLATWNTDLMLLCLRILACQITFYSVCGVPYRGIFIIYIVLIIFILKPLKVPRRGFEWMMNCSQSLHGGLLYINLNIYCNVYFSKFWTELNFSLILMPNNWMPLIAED